MEKPGPSHRNKGGLVAVVERTIDDGFDHLYENKPCWLSLVQKSAYN